MLIVNRTNANENTFSDQYGRGCDLRDRGIGAIAEFYDDRSVQHADATGFDVDHPEGARDDKPGSFHHDGAEHVHYRSAGADNRSGISGRDVEHQFPTGSGPDQHSGSGQ